MGTKSISVKLSEQEIDRAIKELANYKQVFLRKVDAFRESVSAAIAKQAQSGFNGAIVDDLLEGGKKLADVNVTVNHRGTVTTVIANGEDAVWVEFGAGVYHNGAEGSSPHPKGTTLGFTIGGYGKGLGKKETWGFFEDGQLFFSHGTPMRMPMERAFLSVCSEISQIARKVFG